jgi:hypothetical protein
MGKFEQKDGSCLIFDVLLRDLLRAGDLAFSFEIELEGEKKSTWRVASARAWTGGVDGRRRGVSPEWR